MFFFELAFFLSFFHRIRFFLCIFASQSTREKTHRLKRFCLITARFVIGIMLLYLPLVWAAGLLPVQSNVRYIPANYGLMGMRLEEASHQALQGGPDVLFAGSSHCYRSFDTRLIDSAGIRCFNLGSSNQTPRQTYALLDRYFNNYHIHPQLVVIEVHPDIMENSGNESAIDILSNTYIDRPMLSMALRQHSLQVFNTLCCSSIDRLLRGNKALAERLTADSIVHVSTTTGDTTVNVDFTYIKGGFVELTPYCYKSIPLKPKTIIVRNDQLQWLQRCLRLLDSHSTPYLLVEVPSTRACYQSYTNHNDFEQKIRSLVDRDEEYLNLNDNRQLTSQLDDSTCFFDDDHLNQKGATILTKYIIQCIL